jgi:hypothetical protein
MKLPLPLNSDFGRDFRGCGERERCASDVRWHRIAPARKELRNGSNKSEREPTSGRSTDYGSGHPVQAFHDIGRTSLFHLSLD